MNHHLNTVTHKKQQNVLFDQLPEDVKAEIKHFLLLEDFRAAKAIYDKHSKKS